MTHRATVLPAMGGFRGEAAELHTPDGTLVCPGSGRATAADSDCSGASIHESDDVLSVSDRDSVPHAVLVEIARTRVGATLRGKYRLDAVLGVGGMAAVYSATHVRNASRVAVKVLHREVADRPALVSHFLREGYATNTIGHPGTVRVFDDDMTEDGLPFLVMDRLDGETLASRFARTGRPMQVEDVVHIVGEVLDVLATAHDKGTVHRDIKPENVFLTRDGAVKVLDFGIAYVANDESLPSSPGLLGTPAYMAPEQAGRITHEVDARSDIWSVGALAFVLLSGRYVHDANTPQETVLRAATEPAPPLCDVAPEVPPEIGRIINRALAFDACDRWRDAAEMREALVRASERPAPAAIAFTSPTNGA